MNHIEWANRYLCKQWINTDDRSNIFPKIIAKKLLEKMKAEPKLTM